MTDDSPRTRGTRRLPLVNNQPIYKSQQEGSRRRENVWGTIERERVGPAPRDQQVELVNVSFKTFDGSRDLVLVPAAYKPLILIEDEPTHRSNGASRLGHQTFCRRPDRATHLSFFYLMDPLQFFFFVSLMQSNLPRWISLI